MEICSKVDVTNFLASVEAKLLLDKVRNLYIVERVDRKNQDCMAELALTHNDVVKTLLKLDESNYYQTVDDITYIGNKLWEFGTNCREKEVYIKLGIRTRVICVSFHFPVKEITYPYRRQ